MPTTLCPATHPIRNGHWVTCDLPGGHGPRHEGMRDGVNHHWHADLRDPAYLTVAHYPPNVAQSLLDTRRGAW